RLQEPLMLAGAHEQADHLVPGTELLGKEIERRRSVAPAHEEAVAELPRVSEGPPDRPDDVQRVVGLRLREPGGPRPDRVEDDLEGSRPTAAAGGLMDGERPPQEEGPAFGDPDLDEMARLGPLRDLRRDQREGCVRARTSVRKDFTARADHAISSPTPATAASAGSGTITGRRPSASATAAWYSCRLRTAPEPMRTASIPCTAARTPGIVVMHGTPA